MPFNPSSSGEIQPVRLPMLLIWIQHSARALRKLHEGEWLLGFDGNMSNLGLLAVRSPETPVEKDSQNCVHVKLGASRLAASPG